MRILIYFIRAIFFRMKALPPVNSMLAHLYFRLLGIKIAENVKIYKIPIIKKHPKSVIKIGSNVLINSSKLYYSVGIEGVRSSR